MNMEGQNNVVTDTKPNGHSDSQSEEHSQEQQRVNLPVHQSRYDIVPLPQNRPIEPSHLHLAGTYSSFGNNRPISCSDLKVAHNLSSSGLRPVSETTLNITEVLNNRPIASNESDETEGLMGYLD